jgi:predicted CXXCH cytochrome family protein
MNARAAWVFCCAVAALAIGCSSATRHKALTVFFDGVPEPKQAAAAEGQRPDAAAAAAPAAPGRTFGEHGPYAAKLCGACHQSAATNALVVPKDELCFVCHELPRDKRYVHGPLASGGCLACHDPHSSKYRYLLVSEAEGFCLECHDRQAVMRVAAHAGVTQPCTDCHDAHMSDNEYLLR